MILLELLLSFIQIGLFSIGGGYAAIPLIKNQVVDLRGWLSLSEFTDLVTIAEMTPGPIAINSATFVGIRIAGLSGAIVATLGVILPSIVIASVLFYVYFKYSGVSTLQDVLSSLRPAVVALIAAAAISILRLVVFATRTIEWQNIDWIGALLFLFAFIVLRRWKTNPIIIMGICGVAGLGLSLLFR